MSSKHGITMLPKRYFAKGPRLKNRTLDGLHLSQAEHNAMAALIASVIDGK